MKDYNRNFVHLNRILIQENNSELQCFVKRYRISQRELEILIMVALYGLSNREVAAKCVISEKTVKNHISNIMGKIGVRSMRKLSSCLLNHVLSFYEQQQFESRSFQVIICTAQGEY